MPQTKTSPAVAAVTSLSVSAILEGIPSHLPMRKYAGPTVTVVREDAVLALAAIRELLEAVKHEGSIRAIDAGRKVTEWRNHLSPVLRAAFDNAGGEA